MRGSHATLINWHEAQSASAHSLAPGRARSKRPSVALQHGPSRGLFTDAETSEDFSQKIVGCEFSRDFAQRLLREP